MSVDDEVRPAWRFIERLSDSSNHDREKEKQAPTSHLVLEDLITRDCRLTTKVQRPGLPGRHDCNQSAMAGTVLSPFVRCTNARSSFITDTNLPPNFNRVPTGDYTGRQFGRIHQPD